jgi:hypothetical protein
MIEERDSARNFKKLNQLGSFAIPNSGLCVVIK